MLCASPALTSNSPCAISNRIFPALHRAAEEVFTPIVPLLDFYDRDEQPSEQQQAQSQASRSRLLSPASLNSLLLEEEASLRASLDKFSDGQ